MLRLGSELAAKAQAEQFRDQLIFFINNLDAILSILGVCSSRV